MYIPHISASVYLFCFYSKSILQLDHFHGIIFCPVLCFALFVLQCLYSFELQQNVFKYISNISANFQLKILQSDIFTASVIHNISIATYDGVIQFGYDVNIYPVYLSMAIIIL